MRFLVLLLCLSCALPAAIADPERRYSAAETVRRAQIGTHSERYRERSTRDEGRRSTRQGVSYPVACRYDPSRPLNLRLICEEQ